MLPTNEKAQLNNLCVGGINKEVFQLKTNNSLFNFNQFQDWNLQHLYITSDEEIKVDDWMYSQMDGYPTQWDGDLSESKNPKEYGYNKIISTTDKSITTPGYNSFDEDDICNCYLPKPSQQFIEKYIEEYNKGNIITDVLVEYNKATYEKWMKNGASPVFDTIKVNPKDNTITIKKVKDSYSREEVRKLCIDAFISGTVARNKIGTVKDSEIELKNMNIWLAENL